MTAENNAGIRATLEEPVLSLQYEEKSRGAFVRRLSIPALRAHLFDRQHTDWDCLLHGLSELARYDSYFPDTPDGLSYYATGDARESIIAYIVGTVAHATTSSEQPIIALEVDGNKLTSVQLSVRQALAAFNSEHGRDELVKKGIAGPAASAYDYLLTDRLDEVRAQAAVIRAAQQEREKIRAELRAELAREQQEQDVRDAVAAEARERPAAPRPTPPRPAPASG